MSVSLSRRALIAASTTTIASMFAASASAAPPAGAGTGWDVVFADEFAGTTVDAYKWDVASPGWTMPNSASTASASKVAVGGGNLTLTATRNGSTNGWTSGSVSTYTNYRFDGGYVEARMRLPSTAGSWPAFWGLYDGWPPEMDIMEYPLSAVSGSGYANDTYHTAFHYKNASGGNSAGAGSIDTNVDLRNTWHTFGAHWVSDTKVDFYFDGVKRTSFTSATDVAEMADMYLILDYAVGGWPGTPTTAQWGANASDTTLVDYVRVWQQRAAGATETSAWATNGGGGWDAAANWTGIVPKHGGQAVTFGRAGANTATASAVTWNGIRVLGSIAFDADSAYTLAGGTDASIQMVGSGATPSIRLLATNAADQTINSRVEIQDSTDVVNDSARTLTFNGLIRGGGELRIDGPGVVQFANNNVDFVGDTIIDSGAAGPAVARVTRSHVFGTTGTVRIAPVGNDTTARLEIRDNRTIRNPIAFHGRNNPSAGLVNLAGDNVFTGTVSANTGGTTYLIQSDAGLMTLNGVDGGGVALTSAAGGTRTFTLGGEGNGLVSGAITNGTATLSLTKAGAGTWTLGGANAYTGNTVIVGGTLVARYAATGASAATPILGGPGFTDVQSARLVLDYAGSTTPAAAVRAILLAGLPANGGAGRIRSSTDAADASRGIGYGDLGGSLLLVRSTYYGDATLDGIVDVADLGALATNYGATSAFWAQGDFNYDAGVDVADLGALATYYGRGTGLSAAEAGAQLRLDLAIVASQNPAFAAAIGVVPEPALLASAATLGVALLARRRRRA